MKKYYFFLLISATVGIISCHKNLPLDINNTKTNVSKTHVNSVDLRSNDLHQIAEDSVFLRYMINGLNLVYDIDSNNLIRVNELLDKDSLSDSELNELAELMNFANWDEAISFVQSQESKIEILDSLYGFLSLTDQEIDSIVSYSFPYINRDGPDLRMSCLGVCKNLKTDCLAKAAAMYIILNVGCVTADLTVWGGILCHFAVAAYTSASNNECINKYKQCVAKCGGDN